MTKLETKCVEFAQAIAHSINHNFKHVTFITNRNRIICFGVNNPYKTHPLANRFGHRFACIHSEVDAITNFPAPIKYLPEFKFINIRVRADSSLGMAKPCVFCTRMLTTFGVTELLYTNQRGEFKEL